MLGFHLIFRNIKAIIMLRLLWIIYVCSGGVVGPGYDGRWGFKIELDHSRVTRNLLDSKIFCTKTFQIKRMNCDILNFTTNVYKTCFVFFAAKL